MLKTIPVCFCTAIFLAISTLAIAQQETFLERLNAADPDAVDAVVQYPEEVRDAIFEASLYPEALIRMKLLQTRAMREFQTYLSAYDESLQKKLWEMTRYPNLVGFMGEGKKDPQELLAYLQDYPNEIHTMVLELNGYNQPAVAELEALNAGTEAAYRQLLGDYPAEAQQALSVLVPLPDVLEILTDNIEFTTELGDIYRENPDAVKTKAAELHEASLEASEASEEDWYTRMADDPEALEELEETAYIFKQEDDTPDYVYQVKYADPDPNVKVTVYANYYPYAYWYGYPVWYPHSHWYHHHWTWHAGYYVAADGTVIIVSTPSYYYSSWYWYTYPYAYPHLAYHYTRHYVYYKNHSDGPSEAVRDWARENRDRLPEDWERQTANGPEWFREEGDFENRFKAFREQNPDLDLDRKAFLEQNADKYPNLATKIDNAKDAGIDRENFITKRNDGTSVRRQEATTGDRQKRTSETLDRKWERKKQNQAGRDDRDRDRKRPQRRKK